MAKSEYEDLDDLDTFRMPEVLHGAYDESSDGQYSDAHLRTQMSREVWVMGMMVPVPDGYVLAKGETRIGDMFLDERLLPLQIVWVEVKDLDDEDITYKDKVLPTDSFLMMVRPI